MTESRRQAILREKFFRKISTYILKVSERVDVEPYIPILELLRWLFVPSIEHRILTLLEHFVYNNNSEDSSCNESPQNFLCDMDSWLDASTKLNQLLKSDGLSRIFVDSILLGNRIARIGRQLDNLGVNLSCENIRNMDNWNELDQSTRYPSHDVVTVTNNKAMDGRRQSRKRKATYDEEEIPADISMEDQTERTKHQQRQQRDKLRLVVTELPSSSNEEGSCCCSSSRRRTDYLKLPCDCRALKEKLFKHQTPKHHSGKFDQRLKNVCSCVNNVMDRTDDEAVNDAALSCELRKNYVRFKLGRIKSKLCMFATRVAFNRQQKSRRKDKLRENDVSSSRPPQTRYCWSGNCSGYQRDLATVSSDNVCDRSVNSGKSERGFSTRFLWNPSRHCFATSSVEDDSSDGEKNNFMDNKNSNNVSNCECKSQENCPCVAEKTSEVCETKSPKINDIKRRHFEVITDDIDERDCNRTLVELKNAEIMTDEVDEPVELTNIYVNEISICCCCEGYDTQEDIGINTESIINLNGKCNIEVSTNTEGCRFREISTQVFFKEIQFCTCYKNVDDELEIENVKLENQEFDFNCEYSNETIIDQKIEMIEMNNKKVEQNMKETPFDDVVQKLAESPNSSEFTEMMKVKITEIVDSNQKIREKVNMIKDHKDVCSVSVQTLIKQKSCDSVNMKIQVNTSAISFKSKVSGKTCASKPSNKEMFVFNNIENSALKKSILTEVTASLEHPILQKLKTDVIYQCVKMSTSSSFTDSYFRSDTSSIEKFFIYSENSCYKDNKNNNTRNICRCSKKSNFLNFLSDYLTRETFEKFKRILRFILKKLLEKAKQLNELRKSRMRSKCHCYCCREENSVECCSSETCSCEKNSAPRLSGGGGDVSVATAVSHDSSRESKPAKFTRSAFTCRDLDYATKKTQRRYRRKRSRRKFVNDIEKSTNIENGNGLRRCRTEIFASARNNACAYYRNSLAFTDSWKYCYIR